mgnify:CR=1 FL=1
MLKEYNVDVQRLFLQMMLTNAELYTRVMNIMNAENFDKSLRPVAEFMVEYSEKYSLLPDSTQIKATTGQQIESIEDFGDKHTEWFLAEFEAFTKRQELERAILKSADLLDKGDFGPVEKLIKDLNLIDNIVLLDYVPQVEIPIFYKKARCLIMPTYFGPTNIPPLEAIAIGCPVGISDIYAIL